ncbi:MAG: hypothetical protein V1777_01320 [Candidatus Micrarchaeota archaeon]
MIELVPWTHVAETQKHEDVIKYVESLPKGTIICLEVSQSRLEELNRIISSPQQHDWSNNEKKSTLAHIELIYVCEKNCLKIAPLGQRSALRKYQKIVRNKQVREHSNETDEYEFAMAQNAKKVSDSRPGKKIVIITGALHTIPLFINLRKLGAQPNIVTAIFRDATNRRKMIALNHRFRRTLLTNSPEKRPQYMREYAKFPPQSLRKIEKGQEIGALIKKQIEEREKKRQERRNKKIRK